MKNIFHKIKKKIQEKQNKQISERTQKVCNFLNRYSLIFHYLLSCAFCFVIECASRHSLLAGFEFIGHQPLVYLYNAMIVFITFLPVYLFRRRALARILIGSIWTFMGIINGCVLLNRITPFGFTDLKLISDLLEMKSNYFTDFQMFLVITGIVLFLILCIIYFFIGPKYKGKRRIWFNVVALLSCFLWVPMVTDAAVANHVLSDYFSNIAEGYKDYGFVYGFSISLLDQGMSKPETYTKETVTAIEDKVEELSDTTSSKKNPNVILVLLESFVDPSEISFMETSKDPVPNFHELKRQFTTGHLTVPVVGAGTANSEFEILTGMNMRYFGTGEYPYKTTLKKYTCESIAHNLGNIGYGTHVVHNNGGNFYSRVNAFSQMGFDSFTSKELMNITEYTPLNTWPTDHILINETMKTLDATPNQPDFTYIITVQGHGIYPTEKVIEDPEITVTTGLSEETNNQWEYYINEIHEVDQFIGDLTDELSKRDEETIVVFFGDHLPTFDLTDEDMKAGSIFQTQYVTWNNFGLEKNDKDLASYQLMAYITDQLDIHEGTMFNFHQTMDDTTESYDSDMEILQYDILYGEKYAYGEQELYPASDLVMGISDVTLDCITESAYGTYVLLGTNFTNWSRVYVNGEKIPTTYVNGTRLEISKEDIESLEDGDVVTVRQMGSSNTCFRSSNQYIYHTHEVLHDDD